MVIVYSVSNKNRKKKSPLLPPHSYHHLPLTLSLSLSNHRTRWTNDPEKVPWTLNGKPGLLAMSLPHSTSSACSMRTRRSVRDPCLQLEQTNLLSLHTDKKQAPIAPSTPPRRNPCLPSANQTPNPSSSLNHPGLPNRPSPNPPS